MQRIVEPMSYAYRLEGISTYDCLELNPPQIGYNGCSRGNERPQLLRAQLLLPRLTRRCEMWRSTGYASGWSCNWRLTKGRTRPFATAFLAYGTWRADFETTPVIQKNILGLGKEIKKPVGVEILFKFGVFHLENK